MRPSPAHRWLIITLSLLTLTMTQCTDDSQTTPRVVCDPGLVRSCPCPGGDHQGAQRCDDAGERWEACLCADEPAPKDMGTRPDLSSAMDMTQTPPDMRQEVDMKPPVDQGADDGCVKATQDATKRLAGQTLYGQYCAACHGAQGQGSQLGPKLWEEVAEESDRKLIKVILNGDDDMPPIPISEAQAKEVIGYLLWEAQQRGERTDKRCEEDDD